MQPSFRLLAVGWGWESERISLLSLDGAPLRFVLEHDWQVLVAPRHVASLQKDETLQTVFLLIRHAGLAGDELPSIVNVRAWRLPCDKELRRV